MLFASTTYLHANNLTTQIQIMLNELNFNAGSPDGIYGKRTKSALNSFYRKYNKNYDGNLSQNEFDDILSKMPKAINNKDLIIKVSNNRHNDSFIKNTLNLENYKTEINLLNTASEKNDKKAPWLQKKVTFEDERHLISRAGIGAHPSEISGIVGDRKSVV